MRLRYWPPARALTGAWSLVTNRPLFTTKPSDGVLRMGPLEIAQVSDDEHHPEARGLHIQFEGGR